MEKQNFLIERRSWYKRWWGVLVLVLSFFSVVALLWFSYLYISVLVKFYNGETGLLKTKTITDTNIINLSEIIDNNDPFLGKENALLTIVEFGDFNCPVCKKNYPVIRELVTKYPDIVKVYWKNLPVVTYDSLNLAIAAECANQQEKFWNFHDRAFARQGDFDSSQLDELATQLGLNKAAFNFCLQSQEASSRVTADFQVAQELDLEGTPSFVVNGFVIQGYVPMEVWDDLIMTINQQIQ